jgi:predicted house-cleaning noncanonical NTP pyrophosphatase (MazG superfamily)
MLASSRRRANKFLSTFEIYTCSVLFKMVSGSRFCTECDKVVVVRAMVHSPDGSKYMLECGHNAIVRTVPTETTKIEENLNAQVFKPDPVVGGVVINPPTAEQPATVMTSGQSSVTILKPIFIKTRDDIGIDTNIAGNNNVVNIVAGSNIIKDSYNETINKVRQKVNVSELPQVMEILERIMSAVESKDQQEARTWHQKLVKASKDATKIVTPWLGAIFTLWGSIL